jgi:hypothetical protein
MSQKIGIFNYTPVKNSKLAPPSCSSLSSEFYSCVIVFQLVVKMRCGVDVWYHALKSVCIMILYLKKMAYAPVMKTVFQVSAFNELKMAK